MYMANPTGAEMTSVSCSLAMRSVIRGVQIKFPSVKNVTTATLQSWMNGETVSNSVATAGERSNKLIIIDARPEQEYLVSHIAKSINVNSETDDMAHVKELLMQEAGCESADEVTATVVLYCSVGYRSSILTEKLVKATKPDPSYKYWQFFNLEGSLFKWANENRSVLDEREEVTNYVHPYNGVWGRLIDRERWKYAP